ncbi:hypothetical protein AC482_00145 [miscellaneous Crenarchaeota group-15 archaeon DG-45]|uniref:NH(3)-dependent NAD(+) synthetase n=1 Tax=miscellaneous Crenarchaeota group-15 archaeon DG-45 TaxID=1685127 RepID=A0A0M0BT26_9ARCH|nr:MAG: hypothetical protein AC482_00145 [miscellaneous Crenarchaeota group-15 archaeon DG-45]
MLSEDELSIDAPLVADKISQFISDQIDASGLKGAVVAVSGGIDSAVTLALTVRAIGSGRVRAVTMPERDITPPGDMEDVMRLTETLDVTCDVVEITPMIHVTCSTLPFYDASDLVSSGNVKARLRMIIAYHYANSLRSMVIGSSNKTEWLVGYFTKYGDGGVDLMPIAGLYKTQVRQLARHLGIRRSIIEKTPTAGLWPGQSDEDELGIKYEVLDVILHAWERGMDAENISRTSGVDRIGVERVLKRIKENEHKRRLPLILRLSSIRR